MKLSSIMADLSDFTIPPSLFYSNTPAEIWKPMRKIAPVEITKKLKTFGRKHVVRRKTKSVAPALGRIGKVKRNIIKKILKKKKLQGRVLKEKSGNIDGRQLVKNEDCQSNNNNKASGSHFVKLTTKQNERILLKEIKDKEEAIKKRLFSNENFSRKRVKGSSFKFFKSKNVLDEDESSQSDHSEELVPEIKDFYDKQASPNTSFVVVAEVHNEPRKVVIDPAAFEEEESEPDIEDTTIAIESLLKKLDYADDSVESAKPSMTSDLDELIETLEGPSAGQIESTESSQAGVIKTLDLPADKKVEPVKKPKPKFMGLGHKQLQIDAGQKKFGLVECKECGFSYNTNVPEDEKLHNKHHQETTSIPRFPGWKKEDAISIAEWSEHNGRIVRLEPNHKMLDSHYITEIINKMEMEFGAQDDYKKTHIYLAVHDSKIVGLTTAVDHPQAQLDGEQKVVRLGIQRLYIRPEYRRKGFARVMLKTIVIMHEKGVLLDLRNDVAFSSPTDDGKKLIRSVVGTDNVFVFTH